MDSRDLINGTWKLVDTGVRLTHEFSRDGTLKLTTGYFVVNGEPIPLTKDGQPIEGGTLNGKYRFANDGTIEGEVDSPIPRSDSRSGKFRVKPVRLSGARRVLPGQRAGVSGYARWTSPMTIPGR